MGSMEDIMARLPHRYPFLMVDRIVSVDPGKSARAIKNVTINEPYFAGHFPSLPVVPGVLLIETIAQVAALAVVDGQDGKVGLLAGVDKARFKRPVVPGDRLEVESVIEGFRSGVGKVTGTIHVDGTLVAQAQILFALRDKDVLTGR